MTTVLVVEDEFNIANVVRIALERESRTLQDEAVDPKQAAEVLSLESARLRRLIADLLDLARIDRSEFTIVDEPVDLAVTAREVVARFDNLAGTLGVVLEADAGEPAPARGDVGRLLQVASNLVENALRAPGRQRGSRMLPGSQPTVPREVRHSSQPPSSSSTSTISSPATVSSVPS